jgi:hypothetical protein
MTILIKQARNILIIMEILGVHQSNAYTFDPGYNYASIQGAKEFLGVRWEIK